MPIEIKELHIKVSVGDDDQSGQGKASAGKNDQSESIIAACVEQVIEILKEKKER